MNIDELTYGQIKELRGCVAGKRATKKAIPPGRYIIVVDRGWIFAGDTTTTEDGYVRLTNAIHVFSWSGVGFAAMVRNWKEKTDLRPVADVEVPNDAIVFRVPVPDGWGVK